MRSSTGSPPEARWSEEMDDKSTETSSLLPTSTSPCVPEHWSPPLIISPLLHSLPVQKLSSWRPDSSDVLVSSWGGVEALHEIPAPHAPRFSNALAEPTPALKWDELSSSLRVPPLTRPLQPLILPFTSPGDTAPTDPGLDAHTLDRSTGVHAVPLGRR